MSAGVPAAPRARVKRSAFSAVALVVLAALLTVAVGSVEARASSGIELPLASPQQARQFWTPARMRAAEPVALRRPGSGSLVGATAGASAAGETTLRIPALAPSGASASSKFEAVPDPTVEGARETGAIFFQVGFDLARCSGTAVNAPNLSVVITAGHCVHSGGRRGAWYRGMWVFVPGYRYGQRPFGVFPAKRLDATHEWVESGTENADVAAAVVTRNERGERLGDAVGGTGIAFGLKADRVFDVRGYPAAPPFDGEVQRVCQRTPFLGHDSASFLSPGPLNLAVDCNVSGGASGGGWTTGDNLLNSVTNYGYGDDSATDFGAYFGKEVARLYARAGRVR